MDQLSRRQFGQNALAGLAGWSFFQLLIQRDAFAEDRRPAVVRWLREVNELGIDVKGQKLPQLEWQKQIEKLYATADVAGFLQLVDFDKLVGTVEYPEHGARSLRVKFPAVEGIPEKLAFGQQIFALRKDRSVVPHGHNNMATAFLILKGEFEGRHYDRLEDQAEHIIIKPTIDRAFKPGDCSTVSDRKDNIHWFKATTETAFIYNIHVLDVTPGAAAATGRVYLDPNGEKLADGTVRAKRVDYETVNRLYG